MVNVADLFREPLETWGLRGDPHLWDEMRHALAAVPLPEQPASLECLLQQQFQQLAGVPLTSVDHHFVPRFDSGGMSSGYVSPQFWRSEAIPLLLARAARLKEHSLQVSRLLSQARTLAKEYRALTGKPLGITGEVAEFAAAQILGLSLSGAREAGFDAVKLVDGREIKVQIKGRCLAVDGRRSQQIGSIDLKKPWDTVLLVLLDHDLEPLAMYEAGRVAVEEALSAPGSRARNERGSLAVSKFKQIAKVPVWVRPSRT